MLQYVDNSKGFDYAPKGQVDETPFTVKLRPMSVETLAELNDMLMTRTSTEVKTNYGAYYVHACKQSIIDWNNIVDSDGNQVPMGKNLYGTIDEASLNKIPYDMIEDIGSVAIVVSSDPSKIKVFSI